MNPEFKVHMLNEIGKSKATAIATALDDCLEKLKILCPEGRYLDIAKEKLEMASFFAKKAMACHDENCQ